MSILKTDAGHGIYYDEMGPGDGMPVLLIHGLSGNSDHWGNIAPRLADAGYRAIWGDWPGHHRSDWDIPHYTFDDIVDGFIELAEKLCGTHRRIVVAGHSAGGAVAQMFYHRHPERIAALCLLQTTYSFVRPELRQVYLSLLEPYSQALYNPAIRGVYRGLDNIKCVVGNALFGEGSPLALLLARGMFESNRETALEVGRALIELDLGDQLADIHAPALVVSSRADQIVPLRFAKKMAAEIPGAQLRIINYVGHNGHIMGADETADAMLDFLGRLLNDKP